MKFLFLLLGPLTSAISLGAVTLRWFRCRVLGGDFTSTTYRCFLVLNQRFFNAHTTSPETKVEHGIPPQHWPWRVPPPQKHSSPSGPPQRLSGETPCPPVCALCQRLPSRSCMLHQDCRRPRSQAKPIYQHRKRTGNRLWSRNKAVASFTKGSWECGPLSLQRGFKGPANTSGSCLDPELDPSVW